MLNTRLLAWLVAALGICATAEAQVVGELVDQNNDAYQISVYSYSTVSNRTNELADDFVVPAGESWTPSGFTFDADTNYTPALSIQIRTNAQGNSPGTAVTGCSATGLVASVSAETGFSRVTYTPTWNCTLSAGTYWLWVQPTAGETSFRWRATASTFNTRAKARPTGSQWGSQCDSSTWINVPGCVKIAQNASGSSINFLFTINGGACKSTDATCDNVDDDCSGTADDDAPTVTYYADSDSDTYGDSNATTVVCADRQPSGTVTTGGDCDDNAFGVNPGVTEICNDIDDNCVNGIDEDLRNTYYADVDDDTFGDANSTLSACSLPTTGPKYVEDSADCDDNASAVNPDANESCNDIDDNCRDGIDEGVKTVYYFDDDGDGYGDTNSTAEACPQNQPGDYAAVGGDCDNNNEFVYPDANESCNGIDDNCKGGIDEGVTTTFYADDDRDGYGDANDTTQACSVPNGYSTLDTDCDDNASAVNPGETDVSCDDVDNDCSLVADDGDSDDDSTPDCDEECDDDGDKTVPGKCGCGLAETETETPECGGGDADDDGLVNGDECADAEDCQDTDGDGTPDYLDTDSDGDGASDESECPDAICDDSDDDGLTDQLERSDADSDGDGKRDQEDDDSDNDGDDDGEECVANVCLDEDEDGIRDHLDDSAGDGDLDDDTIKDSVECNTLPCGDTDDDGIPDYGDTDSDDDTVLDGAEANNADRIDPCKPNANALACLNGDFDGDGVPNSTDVDPSDECKPNPDVVVCATGDADDDGTPNGTDSAPTNACAPNPNALSCPGGDTDGDTVPNDGDSAPNNACVPNADAVACASGDYDKDGAPNGTDTAPKDACIPSTRATVCATGDSDDDGTVNGTDPAPQDPCVPTTDAIACGTGDADDDGTINVSDPAPLDPCEPSTDVLACAEGDGDLDGTPNGSDPKPEDACVPDEDAEACPSGDSDDDGVPNDEDSKPLDPCKPTACGTDPPDGGTGGPVDSDDDGVSDDDECGGKDKCPDTDGDGKPDNEDSDDDGDGIPTIVEQETADDLDIDDDLDGDGKPNWLDDDADGDGIPDRDEIADRDGDGVPDVLDSDKVKLSGGSDCSVSTDSTGTDLASWPLLSLLGLMFWRRRRAG